MSAMRGRGGLTRYVAVHRGGWYQNPSELAADHEPEQLVGHYVVASGPTVAPASWPRRELAGWTLRHDRDLPAFDLREAGGGRIGWILGHPVDIAARRIVTDDLVVPAARGDPSFERRFQDWLYTHGGRFVAIVLEPQPRAYHDVFAGLPILFEPGTRRLSSSPFLLVDPGEPVPDSPLIEILDPFGTSRYYPFEGTCHRDAYQLLPSHGLDLTTFAARRIWPLGPFAPVAPADAVDLVGDVVSAAIEAAAAAGRAAMGLTAGGDSRMMLACARGIAETLELFTVPHADPVGQTDVETATAIAHRFGLDHHCLRWVDGTVDDMRLWYYRTGALAGESRGARGVRTYDQLAADGRRLRLSGTGVELARGIAWTEAEKRSAAHDGSSTKLSAADLLGRISVPRHPLLEAAAERWIASLPDLGPLEAIDLFALETHGGWIGPITLGNPGAFTTTIYPFANRAILDAIFGLPRDYRGRDRLRRDVVASRWPELGAVRINHIPHTRRLAAKAQRIALLPGGAVRRVRRRRLQP